MLSWWQGSRGALVSQVYNPQKLASFCNFTFFSWPPSPCGDGLRPSVVRSVRAATVSARRVGLPHDRRPSCHPCLIRVIRGFATVVSFASHQPFPINHVFKEPPRLYTITCMLSSTFSTADIRSRAARVAVRREPQGDPQGSMNGSEYCQPIPRPSPNRSGLVSHRPLNDATQRFQPLSSQRLCVRESVSCLLRLP